MEALHSSKDDTRDKIEQSKVSLVVWRYNKIAKRKFSYFFLSLHGTVQVLWWWKQKYCTGQYCTVFRTILQEVRHVTDQLQNSRVTSWSWNGGLYTWIDEKIVKMKITRRSNFRALQKKSPSVNTCACACSLKVAWGPSDRGIFSWPGTVQASLHSP